MPVDPQQLSIESLATRKVQAQNQRDDIRRRYRGFHAKALTSAYKSDHDLDRKLEHQLSDATAEVARLSDALKEKRINLKRK